MTATDPSFYLSLEFEVLKQAIQGTVMDSVLEKSTIKTCDYGRLSELVRFHRLRPILYIYGRKSSIFPISMMDSLQRKIRCKAFKNLKNIALTKSLLSRLGEQGIPCIVHKGNQYTYSLYQNRQLRENIDIDLLVEKKHAYAAIRMLISNGFIPTGFGKPYSGKYLEAKVQRIIAAKYIYQIEMRKEGVLIDLQWGIKSNYHSFDFPLETVFSTTVTRDFYGGQILQPEQHALFWLLLIHHGGKEQWMRIRHLVDLMAFLNTYGQTINWMLVLEKAVDYKLERVLLDGFWYLDKVFAFPLPVEIENRLSTHKNKVYKHVFEIWENCYWGNARFEIKSQYIRFWSQDNPNPSLNYFWSYIRYKIEKKQLDSFPHSYGVCGIVKDILNFSSKDQSKH